MFNYPARLICLGFTLLLLTLVSPVIDISPFALAQTASSSKLDAIVEKKLVRVGIKPNFPPFSNPEGTGFDYDLAREIGERWGVRVEFETDEDTENLISKLNSDQIDLIIAAMTQTWPRERRIDFSYSYFDNSQGILVRGEAGDVKSIGDLAGQVILVREGSTAAGITCERAELNLQGCRTVTGIGEVPDRLVERDNDGEYLNAAFISDITTLEAIARDNPATLKVLTDPLTNQPILISREPYAIGVPRGDDRLRDLVNATLQAMHQDGAYSALYLKHFRGYDYLMPANIPLVPGTLDFSAYGFEQLSRDRSRLEIIRQRGDVLVAGVKCDSRPFGYLDADGNHAGFDVELLRAMAQLWGVDVEFACVTSANRIEKLLNNDIDIIAASMTHTWPRATNIAFSQTYFKDGQSMLVRTASSMTRLRELEGKRVGALRGSTSATTIQERVALGDLTLYETVGSAISDLLSGKIDGFTSDSVILSELEEQYPDQLQVFDTTFSTEYYGLGLPLTDHFFIDLVNCTLQELYDKGDFERIHRAQIQSGMQQSSGTLPFTPQLYPGERQCDYNSTPKELPETPPSLVEQIQAGEMITIGVTQKGNLDRDLAIELITRWYEVEPGEVRIKELDADDRIPALKNKEVDLLIATLTHNQERDKEIDYSQTYFDDRQGLLIPANSEIRSLKDLDGKEVVTLIGATSGPNLEKQAVYFGIDLEIRLVDKPEDAVALLKESEEVVAFTSDRLALKQFEDDELMVSDIAFGSEPYGIGLRQFDRRLQNLVNITLQQMKRDGTYDALYCKHYPDEYTPYDIEIWWPVAPERAEYQSINLERTRNSFPLTNPCVGESTGNEVEPIETGYVVNKNAVCYQVRSGDTLSGIAQKFYGDLFAWETLYTDNQVIVGNDPNVLTNNLVIFLRREMVLPEAYSGLVDCSTS